MKILALDTATDACSAALWNNGEIVEKFQIAPRLHTQLILPMINELLTESGFSLNQFSGIAVTHGPGSFTGLRVGLGVAQGLAISADLPIVSVSTLQTMAQGAWRLFQAQNILVALDARMNEVYWGIYQYQNDNLIALIEDNVLAAQHIQLPVENEWSGVGNGWQIYPSLLSEFREKISIQDYQFPHAQDVATLANMQFKQGLGQTPETIHAVYLRNDVVRTGKN